MSLVRKSKKLYYSNLDEKKVTYNKAFWKTMKLFLSDKIVSREKVTLININDPVIKCIVKYRNYPSILKIGKVCNRKQCSLFSFLHVDKEQILKEILSLDFTKASQGTDIPTKIIKDNADIFSDFLF